MSSEIMSHWNKSFARVLWLIVFCFSASLTFGAVPQVRSSYRIPFELTNNLVVLRGSINNSRPLFLLLDTGASGSVINESRVKELGLNLEGQTKAATGNGPAVSVQSGSVRRRQPTAGAYRPWQPERQRVSDPQPVRGYQSG